MTDDLSDPMRLLASPDTTALERALLRSWDGERPSAAARDKTLAMLGLGVAAGLAAAGGSVAPKAIAAGWVVMAKWVALGVVGATILAAGAYALLHARGSRDVSRYAVTAPAETAMIAPTRPLDTQTAVIELPTTVTPRTTTRSAPPAASSLALEVAAVDRARAALDGGDAARARRLVDSYEAEYPTGAFMQEAEVVRIDALVREGNRGEAERVGKRFLGSYPKSPHAVRVRALLGYDP
jgi:hypothetical protein